MQRSRRRGVHNISQRRVCKLVHCPAVHVYMHERGGAIPRLFGVTCLPMAQGILGTQSVPLLDGVLIVAIGVILFAIVEVEKQLRLSLSENNRNPQPTN